MIEVSIPWPEVACWPNRSKGWHWTRTSRARKAQREIALDVARELVLPAGALVAIVYLRPPSRRGYDADNALAALKGAFDGIFEACGRDDSEIVDSRIRRCSPCRPDGRVDIRFRRAWWLD